MDTNVFCKPDTPLASWPPPFLAAISFECEWPTTVRNVWLQSLARVGLLSLFIAAQIAFLSLKAHFTTIVAASAACANDAIMSWDAGWFLMLFVITKFWVARLFKPLML